MTTLLIIVFFGVIFAAGFSWLMSVESTNTDKPKRKKDALYNPATGFPMVGGLDTAGNPFGISIQKNTHHL